MSSNVLCTGAFSARFSLKENVKQVLLTDSEYLIVSQIKDLDNTSSLPAPSAVLCKIYP